ncbi:family 43 glycosylhydrolase [Undibacterium sp. 5I1]|uniref:family 43 glycosylhydrolase n=1 Tax=unclassified Undibacterium TaxID=2630295 RepID=UPI002AB40FA2|nr:MULTISPECIES: family 43 glycosylhydrolase [unclassified Undibacterium]MDY7540397.1 family 43 glycosylhydrolase [Undibacterium sp. 5I1]MEB0230029.1 family 43 glycosylhydrolase [Undibacterium sp. 10I3]MEB0258049.1 family 43 glycosylhydrolase [Undibacterium sp. 5I1]
MNKINRIKKWSVIVGILLSSILPISSAQAAAWTLTGAVVTHDPSMIKDGNTWWIVETSDTGIGVKYSPDGHAWTQGGSIFAGGLSWWGQYNGNSKVVWAPDMRVYNGKAILYYAISTFGSQKSAIGLATASSIAKGDWVDKGLVLSSKSDDNFNAIDPNFVVDKAGQPWLTFGSWWTGIYTSRVDPTTLKPIGTRYHLASDSSGIENAFVMINGGYYYLFVSKGTCCSKANSTYHISYGRSTSITGPYLDMSGNDMLNSGGTTLEAGGGRFFAPGGESVSNGVLARHKLDSQNNFNGVLFLNDLYFSNGWPTY